MEKGGILSDLIPALTFVIITTFTPGSNNTMSLVSGKSNGYIKSLWFLTGSKLRSIINRKPIIFNFVTASLMTFSSVSILYTIIIN